jgi:uncharacterized protein YprB with RNaseH-like and TPR domain
VTAASATLARLRHAVAQHAVARPEPEPPRGADADLLRAILRVETRETPAGPIFVRDDWYAFNHEHGVLRLDAPLQALPQALALLATAEHAPPAERMAYFDIETTGLSGGTGTYVILAGLGSFEADGFRMRQYFLADIAQERAMLAALAAELARFEGLVTYNGRAFDVPCLEGRLTLSRLQSPCTDLVHIDLLMAVRRLFRHRMPGCRLADAERRLLRIERDDDIPGSLIPGMYFDYARSGRVAPLRSVFRHNAEDVLSLAGILAGVAALLASSDLDPEDAVAVARWHERAGDAGRAMSLYRAALPWLAGSDDWAWAAARYAGLCKRSGHRDEATALWSALWSEGAAAAGLELAKHHEHFARDFTAAEAVAAALIDAVARDATASAAGSGLDAASLTHRLDRIRARAARAQAGA